MNFLYGFLFCVERRQKERKPISDYMNRRDLNGIPFLYPSIMLNPKELSKIVHEINNVYHAKYKGKQFAMIRTLDLRNSYNIYYFEVHGFGDYNIVEKISD